MMSDQAGIEVLVEDLLFRIKIETTARALRIRVDVLTGEEMETPDRLPLPSLVVVDLNHKKVNTLAWIAQIKKDAVTRRVPVLAFLSHVQVDLKAKAAAAGCDLIVPRSVFSDQLPQLLVRYTKIRLPDPVQHDAR